MYIYQIIWMDAGIEQTKWETTDLVVAGVLFDYLREVCDGLNDLSMRFCMDCVLDTREI